MSYTIHITRKKNWSAPDGPEISLAEWLALVESDAEMRLGGTRQWKDDEGKLKIDTPQGLASWQAHSRNQAGEHPVWFEYVSGNVQVINPDQEVMGKVGRIAEELGACVQGDDGEFYDAQGNELPPEVSDMPSKSWWKFWKFDD